MPFRETWNATPRHAKIKTNARVRLSKLCAHTHAHHPRALHAHSVTGGLSSSSSSPSSPEAAGPFLSASSRCLKLANVDVLLLFLVLLLEPLAPVLPSTTCNFALLHE